MIKDYPLGFHQEAKSAAVAARCAGLQGKYWEMHSALFSNQRQLDHNMYTQIARNENLDLETFKTCMEDKQQIAIVEDDLAYGSEIGVTGTPKFYVGMLDGDEMTNIKVISGAQPFASFSTAVKSLTGD